MDIKMAPIGVVHSPIKDGDDMPLQGVPAVIEIFPEFRDGLTGIEGDTHINVLCWFDKAERGPLVIAPRKINPNIKKRGVFSLRSPIRPNPVSLTATRLVKVDGTLLHVDPLDLLDGSPVVDIKPYSSVWDMIFWARDVHSSLIPMNMDEAEVLVEFLREAYNYHGERCPEIAVGVKIVFDAIKSLDCDIKHTTLTLPAGINPHVADCLIGITRGTPGNARLRACAEGDITIAYGNRSVSYALKQIPHTNPFELLLTESRELFTKRETLLDNS